MLNCAVVSPSWCWKLRRPGKGDRLVRWSRLSEQIFRTTHSYLTGITAELRAAPVHRKQRGLRFRN
jgi:hypothetical protein